MFDSTGLRKIFLTHTLINAAGIAIAQSLVFLATPYLARRYSLAEFGIYASLVAVGNVFAHAAALRFDTALPSVESGEVAPVYRLALLSCLFTFLFGLAAVALNLYRHLPWPQSLSAKELAFLCVTGGTLQGLIIISSAVLVRSGRFPQIALLRIAQQGGYVLFAVLAVPGGLPMAFILGLGMTAAMGLSMSWRQALEPASLPLKKAACKFWEYPVINMPMSILDTLTLAMPLLFIVQHHGEAAAGNYSQVQWLAAAPLILCASAITQVFYKHAGDVARSGNSPRALMWKTVRGLALIGAALILLVSVFGEPAFALFLGKGWRTDSHYLLLVLLPAIFRVNVAPITSIFMVTEQIRLGALWQLMYAAATWSMLSYAGPRLSLDGLLLAVLVNELMLFTLYLWMADVAVRRYERRALPCAA